jgi:hypothetical protein
MIFDEPSREPLAKTPDLDELRYVALKGVASMVGREAIVATARCHGTN